jgi:hypothetical protein
MPFRADPSGTDDRETTYTRGFMPIAEFCLPDVVDVTRP